MKMRHSGESLGRRTWGFGSTKGWLGSDGDCLLAGAATGSGAEAGIDWAWRAPYPARGAATNKAVQIRNPPGHGNAGDALPSGTPESHRAAHGTKDDVLPECPAANGTECSPVLMVVLYAGPAAEVKAGEP